MNARAYFKSLSTTVLVINIMIGLSAIFLVERIVPAIDKILSENAESLGAVVEMLAEVARPVDEEGTSDQSRNFWLSYEAVAQSSLSQREASLLQEIRDSAEAYWQAGGGESQRRDLVDKIQKLADRNFRAMSSQDRAAQRLGLTGAWTLGILLLLSLSIQFVLRAKLLESLIVPIEKLHSVLQDYSAGNKIRRFADNKYFSDDIRKIGKIINRHLDRM